VTGNLKNFTNFFELNKAQEHTSFAVPNKEWQGTILVCCLCSLLQPETGEATRVSKTLLLRVPDWPWPKNRDMITGQSGAVFSFHEVRPNGEDLRLKTLCLCPLASTRRRRRAERRMQPLILILALALFSSEKWKVFGTVVLSFVCDKYYLIID